MPQYPIHESKWFDVREFVDETTWKIMGEAAAWLIDPTIVRVCDLLREKSGAPVTVNNWHFASKGQSIYKASGYRAVWENIGGKLSQHRCGRAADVKVRGLTPFMVSTLINMRESDFKEAGLTTMESLKYTPSWTHLDCRPVIHGRYPEKGFLIVNQ